MPVQNGNVKLDCGHRLDIVVENTVVLELKAVNELFDVFTAQVLAYTKLGSFPIGLLTNFNVPLLKHGIKRLVF